ncbi:MAG: hypothetical protein R2728_06360 [Chitinophagales bacterium]
MKNKRTVVFAASLKSDRYSNLAVVRLKEMELKRFLVGFVGRKIEGIDVVTNLDLSKMFIQLLYISILAVK